MKDLPSLEASWNVSSWFGHSVVLDDLSNRLEDLCRFPLWLTWSLWMNDPLDLLQDEGEVFLWSFWRWVAAMSSDVLLNSLRQDLFDNSLRRSFWHSFQYSAHKLCDVLWFHIMWCVFLWLLEWHCVEDSSNCLWYGFFKYF